VPDEQPDREALVIRFRPTAPDAILRQAQKEFRRTGAYRVSMFADTKRGDESDEDLINRLLSAAELDGVNPDNNPKFWFCARASDLMDDGFRFVKDNEPGEPDEHYSVDLGKEPSLQDTEKLAAHFPESRSWTR
jgi:hypothetical protein